MDTLHTLLGAALGLSVAFNLMQGALRQDERHRTAYWRTRAAMETQALLDMINQHHALRMNSHRRDSKTGRLLPKGK